MRRGIDALVLLAVVILSFGVCPAKLR